MKTKRMLLLLLMIGLLFAACTPTVPQPTAAQTPAATAQSAVEPSPTPGPTLPPQVPGVNPRKLAASLQDEQGFTCSGIEANSQGYYQWRCERTTPGLVVQVTLLSRTKTELDLIDTNVDQPDTPAAQVAIDQLSWSAGLVNPNAGQVVQSWIAETLPKIETVGDIRAQTFDGVLYRLYGTAEARSLEIGQLP